MDANEKEELIRETREIASKLAECRKKLAIESTLIFVNTPFRGHPNGIGMVFRDQESAERFLDAADTCKSAKEVIKLCKEYLKKPIEDR